MDQYTLSELSLGELKALCRNREIRTTSKTTKPAAIAKIISYHKQHHYKTLKFKQNIGSWKKEELIPEAKAVGADGVLSMRKREIVNVIINTHSTSSKSKNTKHTQNTNSSNRNKNQNKNQNKNIKPKQKTKLNKKVEIIGSSWKKIEKLLIEIYNDLQRGFKPIINDDTDDNKNNDNNDLRELSNHLIDELEAFGDKILPLLPLILEAKSLVHDFQEYHQKIKKSIDNNNNNNNKNKNVYYIGMKNYKRTKDIEQEEIGPFCGIFENIKDFDQWKNDKKIKKKYPKMTRIRFVKQDDDDDDDDDNDEQQNDLEMESEHEEEQQSQEEDQEEDDDDDGSIASEQQKAEEEDLMIPSDEDQDEDQDEEDLDNLENNNAHNHNQKNEDEENEDDEETEDEDHDIEMNKNNKNKNNKNNGLTKSTRSRRKRKRENDDKEIGNDKKRARLNEFASLQISG